MARYTVELGEVYKSGLKIFNFPYVLYDETKKPDFEEKFINHFFFREIGQETVGRFQHYLKCKCDEVLPYYNMLFSTALIEYSALDNYNLTETMAKNNTQSKDTTGNLNQTGTLEHNADISVTGNRTNTLDSTTDRTENTDFDKTNSINETETLNNTTNANNKKVTSDTPTGLLSMTDIKTNVYASKADIEDGSTNNTQNTTANKTESLNEKTDTTTSDLVNATSHDTSTDLTNNKTNENTTNNATTSQNETGKETENYTLTRIGNIGVMTPADMLEKHIALQKKLTTIYSQFFDECEDLFMQIF